MKNYQYIPCTSHIQKESECKHVFLILSGYQNNSSSVALLCPKVRAPKYGSVDVKRYDHSYRAVFSCNYGYHLYGDEYITCDYGKWKGRIPICKREYKLWHARLIN